MNVFHLKFSLVAPVKVSRELLIQTCWWPLSDHWSVQPTSPHLSGFVFYGCLESRGPRQNGRHSTDDIFKCIFLYENVWIPIWISLRFVPKGPINNIPALVQIMAWRRPGDKPLSEAMMVSLLTHICVARPQWVNGAICADLQACDRPWLYRLIVRRKMVPTKTGKYLTFLGGN